MRSFECLRIVSECKGSKEPKEPMFSVLLLLGIQMFPVASIQEAVAVLREALENRCFTPRLPTAVLAKLAKEEETKAEPCIHCK